MAQPTNRNRSEGHNHRSTAMAFFGAVSLGLALLTICLVLMVVPSRAEVDLRNSTTLPEQVGATVVDQKEPMSGGRAVAPRSNGIISPVLTWSLENTDSKMMQPYATRDVVTDTLIASRPSVPAVNDPVLILRWFSTDYGATSVAWGDVDGDGDLDLAAGDYFDPVVVYLNDEGELRPQAGWVSLDSDETNSVAWGDVDGDGDLDLATGNGRYNGEPNKMYLNDGRTLRPQAVWASTDADYTNSVAWGDADGDGDLDLAVGNTGPNKVYMNHGGTLQTYADWTSDDSDDTSSVAWGDVNGDGGLDLVSGNIGSIKLYLTDHGVLQTRAVSISTDNDETRSVALGDLDGDGDLDLAAGNYQAPNKVYLNVGGVFQLPPAWVSGDSYATTSVAWGDVDGDGDLDLATGNEFHPNNVYLNDTGVLQTQAAWVSADRDDTPSVAWGDVDGDGDLDLAVGAGSAANKVYLNFSGVLQPLADWTSADIDVTWSLAWGDMDGDDDLDLAAGNPDTSNKVYLNIGGALQSQAVWTSADIDETISVAWGDVDDDGDLDLAVGNGDAPNKVYLNVGGMLQMEATWVSNDSDFTTSVAWGDVDSDGDLDLAAGNDGQDKVYLNDYGNLQAQAVWISADNDLTNSVAWGDVDRDGDLDLAAGNSGPNKIYLNVNGMLQAQAVWTSTESDDTWSVAWGDVDGDGDLDLAAGNNGLNRLYLNVGGTLLSQAIWAAADGGNTTSVVWGDADSDGDLDLAASDILNSAAVYLNTEGRLQSQANWVSTDTIGSWSVAWGDMDGDGDPDLASADLYGGNMVYLTNRAGHPMLGGQGSSVAIDPSSNPVPTSNQLSKALAPADFYAVSGIRASDHIPISYTLYHPISEPVRLVRAYFSPDGSLLRERTNWRIALPTADTDLTDLTTSPYPTPTIASTHVYTWDVLGSGFMGQSDNVIVRVEALPNLKPRPNSVPGPFQRPYVSSQTYRFRVRGSQVRVMQDGAPVQGAVVYRLPADQTGSLEPYRDGSGDPYRTNGSGYLQGYGEIGIGDGLVALVPITATESYTLYFTNAAPTPAGIVSHTVSALGVQTLTVSSANPLVLFNLDVSLEWDARNDPIFMAQLEQDIRRASELLYDWSNGQAALGKVTVYHAKQHWQDAHVLIYANNRFRPAATEGGIITDTLTETVSISATSVITYLPGQVAMGPVWNRYGDPGSNLGEDWPRALAHELGHFALFLDDNYVGLDDLGLLMPVDTCPGAMADPYRDDDASGYGEFHPATGWLPGCANTLSNRNTGRADWTTVGVFYPWLTTAITNTNPGPSVLPLAVTEVQVVEPITPTTALQTPLFLLVQNGNRVIPDSRARSYLFQDGWAIDLGQPSQDRLLARGAKPGDRLCVYDLGASRLGCETVSAGDTELELVDRPDWQPVITVTPLTSVTLAIDVSNLPAGLSMRARLYPLARPSQGDIALGAVSGGYAGLVELDEPSLVGVIQIWVDEPGQRREIVTDYVIGGNPGRIWSGGGRIWSGGGRIWSGGGRIWSGGAPVGSADGQVMLYNPDDTYSDEWFLTVQASAVAPPLWATLVGKAYQVSASGAAPNLTGMSIAFSYLGSDVPPGEEPWLRIYYWNGETWEQLSTRLDTINNMASAQVRGEGVYALMSSIEVPLYSAGWNPFGYPILETRPVTEALISISGFYTTVLGYDTLQPDPFARWRTFDGQMPQQLQTLDALEFARSYWINVSQPITLFLKGAAQGLEAAPDFQFPPATYFGAVLAGDGFTPTAGMPVTAWIDGRLCGRSVVKDVDGQLMVAVNVLGDSPGIAAGCGQPGRRIVFQVDSTTMALSPLWDNNRTHQMTFTTLAQVILGMGSGWNLLALPIDPTTAYSAQSLLDAINGQGGQCSEIDRWQNGGWDSHIGGLPFNDFTIELGKGYFVKCVSSGSWTAEGQVVTAGVPLSLAPGWNLVSLPYPPSGYSAQTLLEGIATQGGACSEVHRWLNGGWDTHIGGLPFNNFAVEPSQGYFVQCSLPSTFHPS